MRLMLTLLLLGSLSLGQTLQAQDNNGAYVEARVSDPFIELHTGPGRGYPIFYVAERGERVSVLKQRTDWFKVRNNKGKEGWVPIDQMARTLDLNGEPLAVNRGTFEDFIQRKWEMGLLLGDFGGTDAISVYAGYHFTRNISVEASASENFGDFSSGRAVNVSILHQLFPDWRYSPFVTLGGGMRETNPKSSLVATEDRVDDTLHVGVGVRVYLTRHFMLRLQYKNYTVLTNRDDDEEVEEWQLGFSTFF